MWQCKAVWPSISISIISLVGLILVSLCGSISANLTALSLSLANFRLVSEPGEIEIFNLNSSQTYVWVAEFDVALQKFTKVLN